MKTNLLVVWVSLLAFVMDGGTGLLLIVAPGVALGMMGIDAGDAPLAYLRFIGAFVFAIGTLYGMAWRSFVAERFVEWSVLWVATAWARLCVGSTTLVLILSGSLDSAWSSVPVADLGLGVFQLWYLLRSKYCNG